ncbi:adhesion G-protein coupled receptor G6-like [Octopus vulgaris]|uniref:Adhesion G-protein coupled receptor G6-like n=1 Tax=Octopus vulgaris TaxID=6645 RepID=A0AA36BZC0_OCTVU|nr:adhesion G-protein coupled receptor G6-like [Octopus vulgaris]
MFQQLKLTFALILSMSFCLESNAASDICSTCSCRNSETNIDCSYRNLFSIPQQIPLNVEVLYLQYNSIVNISVRAFDELPSLGTLYLQYNGIVNISVRAFDELPSLRTLYLSDNNITYIQRGIFENLPNLQRLVLRNSGIKNYEDGAFLFLPSVNYIDLGNNKDMMCECHLPAIINYTKTILKKNVYILGDCRTDLGELIRIMKYMQCQNYSLFQWNLQCETCSGMKCKDPKVTKCTADEPVCESKLSINDGTVKFEKSCSTYRECLEAMRNNTFTCNKSTSDVSCVVCCTGNLCNKNDLIVNAEGALTNLLKSSQKSVYFKAEDIDLAVDTHEKLVPLIPNLPANITLKNILPSINDIIKTQEELLDKAQQSKRTGQRMLDIIEAIPEEIPLEEQQLSASYSNLAIGAIKVKKDTFDGLTYGVLYGNNENQAKTQNFIQLPKSLLKHLKTEERAAVSRISFFSLKDDKLYRVIQNSNTKANTKINSHIIAATIPNIQITNLVDPVKISFELIDQNANNPQCVFWDESPGQNPKWSTKGCNIAKYDPGKQVLCSCDHLTSFALLTSGKTSHLLSMASYIGCGISLACLILI